MSGKKAKVGCGGRRITRSRAKLGKQHPLMNHLVLESVFDHCSFEDLKVVRQVSPLWRDCARKKWIKSVKLRISQVPEEGQRFPDETREEMYQLFLQLVEGDQQNQALGTRTLETCRTLCAQVKTLELVQVTLPTVQALRNALFHCFPNLKYFTLKRIDILQVEQLPLEPSAPKSVLETQIQDEQWNLKALTVWMKDGYPELPISWMEILLHFPSLEKIDVQASTARMRAQTLFQAVNQIREEDPSKLNLKHVGIWIDDYYFHADNIPPAVLTTLMDKRLQLETLALMGLMGRLGFTSLPDILQIHSGTLQTLAISKGPEVPFSEDLRFPGLTKLKRLAILLEDSPESIEFLKFTPNLKKLVLMTLNFDPQQVPHSNFKDFPITLNECKELCVHDSDKSFSTENWRSFVEWTPNLESLRVADGDNADFAMICEGWPSILELYVESSKVDASGITGWDEEDVKRLDSMRRSKGARTLPNWRPITVPRANVTGLKELQILFMGAPLEPPIKLSRAAGLYGLEMLPELRHLCLENYKIMPKDRSYLEKLFEKYPRPVFQSVMK